MEGVDEPPEVDEDLLRSSSRVCHSRYGVIFPRSSWNTSYRKSTKKLRSVHCRPT